MRQNNMLAMILAGGRGTRLYALTKKIAKPAVYYGGKYRIMRLPAEQLCQLQHQRCRGTDTV